MLSPHLESCSRIYSLGFSVFKDDVVLVENLHELMSFRLVIQTVFLPPHMLYIVCHDLLTKHFSDI